MTTSRWLLAAAASTLMAQAAFAQTAQPQTTAPAASPAPMSSSAQPMTAPSASSSQPATSPSASSPSNASPSTGSTTMAQPGGTGAMSAPTGGAFTQITPAPGADLVGVLQASGQFTTLIKALDATNLTSVLKGAGPLTVFAPTDAAFAALPAGTLDNLMKTDNLPQLQALLTYHVINARIPSIKGHGQSQIATVAQGKKVTVNGTGDSVKVNDATALQSDVKASNGTIYVIDKVLSPDFVAPPAPAAEAADSADAAASTTTKATTTKTPRKKR